MRLLTDAASSTMHCAGWEETHSAKRDSSNICSAVPMFTTVNAWMMAIAQKSSTISQPKNTSQIVLATHVNGWMGLDHGDVWTSNVQISEYVSLGIGSRQKLQHIEICNLPFKDKDSKQSLTYT